MRLLDFIAGVVALLVLGLPLGLLCVLGLRFDRERTLMVGRGAGLFWRQRLIFRPGRFTALANRLALGHFPDGLSLVRGEIALVGPRPLAPLEPHAVASYRIAVRPGLASPYVFNHWDEFGFDSEDAVDYEYALNRSWKGDLSILRLFLSAWIHETRQPHHAMGGSK